MIFKEENLIYVGSGLLILVLFAANVTVNYLMPDQYLPIVSLIVFVDSLIIMCIVDIRWE